MSEYMEKHSVSRIIGAPPGYVGYGEGAFLCEKIRRNPYSLLLLDEIEKAHPDVLNVLLQILEDGTLTDSSGKRVSFKNTIIIMTSNIGSKSARSRKILSFGETETDDPRALDSLKEFFSPELINRIDDIIVFRELDLSDLCRITEKMLSELVERALEGGISLDISPDVAPFIASRSITKRLGARPIRREIISSIESPLAESILKYPNKKFFSVSLESENIVIN